MSVYSDAELNVVFDFLRAKTTHEGRSCFMPLDVFARVCWGWSRANGYGVMPSRPALVALLNKAGYSVLETVKHGTIVQGFRLNLRDA